MIEETNQTAIPFELSAVLEIFSPDDRSRPIPPKGTTFGIKLTDTDIPADVGPLINEHFGEKFSFALVPTNAINVLNYAGYVHLECCPKKEIKDGT